MILIYPLGSVKTFGSFSKNFFISNISLLLTVINEYRVHFIRCLRCLFNNLIINSICIFYITITIYSRCLSNSLNIIVVNSIVVLLVCGSLYRLFLICFNIRFSFVFDNFYSQILLLFCVVSDPLLKRLAYGLLLCT